MSLYLWRDRDEVRRKGKRGKEEERRKKEKRTLEAGRKMADIGFTKYKLIFVGQHIGLVHVFPVINI